MTTSSCYILPQNTYQYLPSEMFSTYFSQSNLMPFELTIFKCSIPLLFFNTFSIQNDFFQFRTASNIAEQIFSIQNYFYHFRIDLYKSKWRFYHFRMTWYKWEWYSHHFRMTWYKWEWHFHHFRITVFKKEFIRTLLEFLKSNQIKLRQSWIILQTIQND